MRVNDFINKWKDAILNNVAYESMKPDALQSFKDDVLSLNHLNGELPIEEVKLLIPALSWVNLKGISERDLFLVISVYLRVHEKQGNFSLKDAEEIFGRTERLYSQEGRAVYGGIYCYIDETLQFCTEIDSRSEKNNVHFNSGNYALSNEDLLKRVSVKVIKNNEYK